jgi:hypothetical protein
VLRLRPVARSRSGIPDWEDPAFLAEARTWIEQALAGIGLGVTGEIEQPHVRLWSTVLRVPTDDGDVWFKAAMPRLAHDVAVTTALARLRPEIVLAPFAVDLERGWMLLPDGGERLREVLAVEQHPRRWHDILPLYADVQIAAAPELDALVESGLPDLRLARLPGLAERLGSELGLEGPGRARMSELCEELAAFNIPETIQHDDLHDGNVFVRPDGYWIFDWGDSVAAHPFMSLVVCLRSIARRFELAERDPDLERLRDDYLARWSSYGFHQALARAAELAAPLGMLCRAESWWQLASGLSESQRGEYSEAGEGWFEEFAAAATAG